jgi:hypothetical protein
MKVYNPTAEIAAAPARRAPALSSLRSARIGLLDNGKVNVNRFFDHVEDLLRSEYGVTEFVRRRKPDVSRPVPPAMLAELSACDAILSAIGD